MTLGPGVEPGPHWWKVSALITAPSLLSFPAPPFFTAWHHSGFLPYYLGNNENN